jgi:DNA-directed RNA polymerase specialized sigma subunit
MKISLRMGEDGPDAEKAKQARVLAAHIRAAKKGDWTARNNLSRQFIPLLQSLAEKRSPETSRINDYIEGGKQGIFNAARKYKPSPDAEEFQIFALDFIETSMDRVDKGGGGFLDKLFGK